MITTIIIIIIVICESLLVSTQYLFSFLSTEPWFGRKVKQILLNSLIEVIVWPSSGHWEKRGNFWFRLPRRLLKIYGSVGRGKAEILVCTFCPLLFYFFLPEIQTWGCKQTSILCPQGWQEHVKDGWMGRYKESISPLASWSNSTYLGFLIFELFTPWEKK